MACCTLNNNDDNKDRFSIRLQQIFTLSHFPSRIITCSDFTGEPSLKSSFVTEYKCSKANYQSTCSRCLGLWSYSDYILSVVKAYPGARDMTNHQLGHLRLWSYSYPVCCYSLSRGTQDDASLAGIARCRWRLINPTTNKHHLSQLQGYHNNLYSTKCIFPWQRYTENTALYWEFEIGNKNVGNTALCFQSRFYIEQTPL